MQKMADPGWQRQHGTGPYTLLGQDARTAFEAEFHQHHRQAFLPTREHDHKGN